jgi:DNA-binding YbaB/EbfC family protein
MMKQAAQVQKKMEEMQASLDAMTVEGSAGAGMVSVALSGKGELRSVKIDPKLADPEETEMLQDLIVAAHADAKKKIEAINSAEMQKLTGGLGLPPGLKLPF